MFQCLSPCRGGILGAAVRLFESRVFSRRRARSTIPSGFTSQPAHTRHSPAGQLTAADSGAVQRGGGAPSALRGGAPKGTRFSPPEESLAEKRCLRDLRVIALIACAWP